MPTSWRSKAVHSPQSISLGSAQRCSLRPRISVSKVSHRVTFWGNFGPQVNYGKARFPTVKEEQFHSLLFWTQLLEHKRQDAGRPLAQNLLTTLDAVTNRLYYAWWVSMRYRMSAHLDATGKARPVATEVCDVFEDVDWLRKHHANLWS